MSGGRHIFDVRGGRVTLEAEIGLSPDPRGGLFGYADAVDALPAPLRDAIVGGAIDGAGEARAAGRLGPTDEVYLASVRVEGAPDPTALRAAVRARFAG